MVAASSTVSASRYTTLAVRYAPEATYESVDDGASESEILSTTTCGASTTASPTVVPSTSEKYPAETTSNNAFQRTRSRPPPSSASILETIHEDDELSLSPTGSKHYEGVVMAGSPARVGDEDADSQGQEATTAAPAATALLMRTRMPVPERGLRHLPVYPRSSDFLGLPRHHY